MAETKEIAKTETKAPVKVVKKTGVLYRTQRAIESAMSVKKYKNKDTMWDSTWSNWWLKNFLYMLAAGCTFGIMYFWAHCSKLRLRAQNTVLNGRRLRFDGSAVGYFVQCLITYLLTLVTFGIYYLLCGNLRILKWEAENTHFDDAKSGEGISEFTATWKDFFLIRISRVLLTFATLGIGAAWANAMFLSYKYENTKIDGKQIYFSGTGNALFAKDIYWSVLTIITLGWYALLGMGNAQERYIACNTATVPLTELAGEGEDAESLCTPENGISKKLLVIIVAVGACFMALVIAVPSIAYGVAASKQKQRDKDYEQQRQAEYSALHQYDAVYNMTGWTITVGGTGTVWTKADYDEWKSSNTGSMYTAYNSGSGSGADYYIASFLNSYYSNYFRLGNITVYGERVTLYDYSGYQKDYTYVSGGFAHQGFGGNISLYPSSPYGYSSSWSCIVNQSTATISNNHLFDSAGSYYFAITYTFAK